LVADDHADRTGRPKTYVIETFGCQMNVHDSERLAGLLEESGYAPATDAGAADVVVINTCAVREHAEDKLYSRLGELQVSAHESGTRPLVAVTGCVAQQEQGGLRRRSGMVDVVVGTQALKQLPALLAQRTAAPAESPRRKPLVDVNPYEDVSFPLGVVRRTDPVRAFVTIIEGCNDFCSFCVVPLTRGHERMRPVAEILDDVREAAASGRREVHLLGQIVNHYQAPDAPGCDFADLLARVSTIEGVDRIRFASPHPRHVGGRLISVMRDLPKVCRHIHLPVQSGSTRILHAMRRRHSRAWYLQLVSDLRREIPELAISTDMIVGFPGETEEDFEETLALVRTVRFSSMFSFKYSPRPGTLAAKRMPDDVPESEKTRRIVALQELQRSIQVERHEGLLGTTVAVLVDGVSRRRDHEVTGRTSQNTAVNLPGSGELLGHIVQVRIERAGPNSLWGRQVAASA
jgi:tRNA-2-methylthio-N6-dimethylallyladenosine synthase